jgi:cobalt-zinc-cadmium efflux system outer membrane protein
MRTNPLSGPRLRTVILTGLSIIVVPATPLRGQERTSMPAPPATLTLDQAREMARRVSPELTAAREALAAAAARERQAGALPNPTLSYQREQTSSDGQTSSQNVASIDQPIEIGGTRGARVAVARYRREVAEAQLAAAQARLEYDVTRGYALAVVADRRASLAEQAASAFRGARAVSQARFVEGDVSGYAHRRIQLEAARYAVLLAEAQLEQRTARLTLASFLSPSPDSVHAFLAAELMPHDAPTVSAIVPSTDSLQALAALHRAELRATMLEAEAAAAEARLASRERIPVPVLTAGLKTEQVAGDDFSGFVAGIALPIPLWDRRRGAIESASAESRRRVAEVEVVRRRVAREIVEAADALRVAARQLELLGPQLGAESQAALRAAQVAYSEGEISLVEWLDAVRAYQEAEATFASLRAETLIRLAALERAVGISFAGDPR